MRMKRLNQAATNCQRLIRGFLARRSYKRYFTWKVSKIICIERFVRSWLAKVDVERRRQELEKQRCLDQASIDLQRLYRGWKGRAVAYKRYSEAMQVKLEYESATAIQSAFRARMARRQVDLMRDERMKEMEAAATYLRKMWLGMQTRKQFLKLQEDFRKAEGSIVTMQRYIRGCLCRGRLWRQAVDHEEQVWAAIEIQRHWRGYKGRVRWESMLEQVWRREMAAAMLQRNLRGWLARAKIARRKRQDARASFEAARKRFVGAQRIQARARGMLARKAVHAKLARATHAAVRIQSAHRGGMVRTKMWEQIRVQRVILIQAAVRGFLVRRRMARLRKKVLLIQKIYRRWLSLPKMRRVIHLRTAVVRKQQAKLIQNFWRQHAEKNLVKKIRQGERPT